MRLLVELDIPNQHPNAILLSRLDARITPDTPKQEEAVVTTFVARLALSLVEAGEATVTRFVKSSGGESHG